MTAVVKHIAAVVVHHRNYALIPDTVAGLLRQGLTPENVVVVDNSEESGRRASLLRTMPEGVTTLFESNHGYAHAVISGYNALRAAQVEADYILVATHEVVLEPGALDQLAAALGTDPSAGVVGPTLLSRDENGEQFVFSRGGYLSGVLGIPRHVRESPTDAAQSSPVARDWIDGAVTLFKSETLRDHPPSELFFLYLEEVEQQARIRRAGSKVLWVPDAVAWQSSNGAPTFWFARNLQLFFRLQNSRLRAFATTPLWIVAHFARSKKGSRFHFLKIAIRGWREGRAVQLSIRQSELSDSSA